MNQLDTSLEAEASSAAGCLFLQLEAFQNNFHVFYSETEVGPVTRRPLYDELVGVNMEMWGSRRLDSKSFIRINFSKNQVLSELNKALHLLIYQYETQWVWNKLNERTKYMRINIY